jgi:predicted DNA-binding protein
VGSVLVRIDEKTYFKLKEASEKLKKSMRDILSEAVERYLGELNV